MIEFLLEIYRAYILGIDVKSSSINAEIAAILSRHDYNMFKVASTSAPISNEPREVRLPL
jgi:hypothetical protein